MQHFSIAEAIKSKWLRNISRIASTSSCSYSYISLGVWGEGVQSPQNWLLEKIWKIYDHTEKIIEQKMFPIKMLTILVFHHFLYKVDLKFAKALIRNSLVVPDTFFAWSTIKSRISVVLQLIIKFSMIFMKMWFRWKLDSVLRKIFRILYRHLNFEFWQTRRDLIEKSLETSLVVGRVLFEMSPQDHYLRSSRTGRYVFDL